MKTVQITMKKTLAIFAISMFCIGFTSCSNEIVDPEDEGEEEVEELILEEDDVPLLTQN